VPGTHMTPPSAPPPPDDADEEADDAPLPFELLADELDTPGPLGAAPPGPPLAADEPRRGS